MSIICKEYVEFVLKQVASTLEINNWSYDWLNFENIAQNYFGVIIPIYLTGIRREKVVDLNLVLKLAPPDERYRVSGAITIMFNREIYVYSKIFTQVTRLQSNGSLSSYVIPKLFYVNSEYCKEAIVIENMCKKGYKPYLETMFLNLDHMNAGLKALAHFHALTIVIKEKYTNLYKEMEATCVPLSETTNKRFIDILLNRVDKAIINFEKTAYEPLLNILKTNCCTFIKSAYTDAKILCLCHGDIWKENMLFQYEGNNPISACLIDFQTVRTCSPAFDVLFFVACSTDTHLRKQHFHQMIDIYHGTLLKILKEENIDEDKYSRDKFDCDLSVVAPTAFIIANTALWLSNGLQEEGHVRSKQKWNTEVEKLNAMNTYKEIIKNLIDDLRSYGYLFV